MGKVNGQVFLEFTVMTKSCKGKLDENNIILHDSVFKK